MARGRLISRSLGSSQRFHSLLRAGGKLGEFCQVLFPLLIANTDDFGRMAGDAFTVKNVVLPTSRRREADFERALDVMATVGLLDRYQVDGRIYLQIKQFEDHQPNLTKRTKSRIPENPGTSGIAENVQPNITKSKITESNSREPNLPRERVSDALFDAFWNAYPKKKAKEQARKAWEKRRPTIDLLNVILAAIERQRRSVDWQKESGRFVPYPATWLNDARWTDEGVDLSSALADWECPDDPPCEVGTTVFRCHQRHELMLMKAGVSV